MVGISGRSPGFTYSCQSCKFLDWVPHWSLKVHTVGHGRDILLSISVPRSGVRIGEAVHSHRGGRQSPRWVGADRREHGGLRRVTARGPGTRCCGSRAGGGTKASGTTLTMRTMCTFPHGSLPERFQGFPPGFHGGGWVVIMRTCALY